MPIYAKRLNGKQKAALQKLEAITGFEPIYQEALDNGDMTFRELWQKNITWLENVVAEASNINTNGCFGSDESK